MKKKKVHVHVEDFFENILLLESITKKDNCK
jgi:hypothetical protein